MARPSFDRIGVVPNLDKEGVVSILGSLLPLLVSAGFSVSVEKDVVDAVGTLDGVKTGLDRESDLLIAVGGDGTMLTVARRYLEWNVPILGVKGGRLGFLTELSNEGMITRLKEGRYRVQERMRISAQVLENGKAVKEFNALNDVVVHVSGSSRIARLRTSADGRLIREYSADGVIVATPTGSTAYSLSAGGPVLTPSMDAIILTPLAPHTLSVRPLIIDARETVRVEVLPPNTEVRVTVDGQKGTDLARGQEVVVKRSQLITRLLVPEDYDFFSLLREKL
jgi:NAD+ kinase